MAKRQQPEQAGLFSTLKPDKSVTTVFWAVLDQLCQMSQGLSAAQQWELHLRLSHELYGRAANGWAKLASELSPFSGQGEGI